MAAPRRWCRITVVAADGSERSWEVVGQDPPDMAVVDEIARHALGAIRLGGRIVLREVDPEVGRLLDLAGLSGSVEMQR